MAAGRRDRLCHGDARSGLRGR